MKIESRGENSTKPILVANFEKIQVKPDLNPKPEEFSNIYENGEYRKQCFEKAREAFLFMYDKEKLDGFLNAKPSEEGRFYLKRTRRYGNILRSMYKLFDVAHLCPEDFNKFLSTLGEFNDKYLLEDLKRGNAKDVAVLNDLEISLNIADSRDFKKYAGGVLSQINETLGKPAVPVEEFHELRREIRMFADLLQVTAAENCGGNLHWLFASLLELSNMIGDKHDELIKKGQTGEIDYYSAMVKINKSFVDKFRKLENYIKKIAGLS